MIAKVQRAGRVGYGLVCCLLAPRQCPSCRRRIGSGRRICRDCAARLTRERGRAVRASLTPASPEGAEALHLVAAGLYRGVWGRVVRAYKADPTAALTELVVPPLAAPATRLAPEPQGGRGPVLVPVPMARVRRRQRGFNPPEALAAALAERLGWSCRPRALRRVRYRRPLRGLSAA